MNTNVQQQNTVLERALLLVRAGYAVIPVGGTPSSKSPLVWSWIKYMPHQRDGKEGVVPTELEVVDWWNRWPNAKLAIIGGWHGLTVIDVDDEKLADDLVQKFNKHAPIVRTPRGGVHIYCCEEESSKSGPLIEGKVDIKGSGGYFIAPPTEGYKKINEVQEPLGIPGTVRDYASDYLASYNLEAETPDSENNDEELIQISAGHRNHTLASLAGTLRRRKLGEEAIAAALKGINETVCEPPLAYQEIASIARSIARYPVADAWVQEIKPLKFFGTKNND